MPEDAQHTDLLVSYSWGGFGRAKREVLRILKGLGATEPWVVKSDVRGIAIVHSGLDNREVIRCCRTLRQERSQAFQFAIKWVPVDHWCATSLEAIKTLIDKVLAPQIGAGQSWAMKVCKRRWQQYHTSEIVEHLAAGIDRKVDLDNPDWLLWVDILGRDTALTLLRPGEIFSLGRPHR
jgi:tRNA acetyltransferase TAN1